MSAGGSSSQQQQQQQQQQPSGLIKKVHVDPDAKNKQCRNVLIYGYCNKVDKGCPYNHSMDAKVNGKGAGYSPMGSPDKRVPPAAPPQHPQILRVDSPNFTPPSKLSSRTVSPSPAPYASSGVFTAQDYYSKLRIEQPQHGDSALGMSHERPGSADVGNIATHMQDLYLKGNDGFGAFPPLSGYQPGASSAAFEHRPGDATVDYSTDDDSHSHMMTDPMMLGGRQPYYPMTLPTPTVAAPNAPLQYHLYMAPLPSSVHQGLTRGQKSIHRFFLNDNLREELLKRNQELIMPTQQQLSLDGAASTTPTQVHNYHSLVPLEDLHGKPLLDNRNSRVFGYPISNYRGINTNDGMAYCLMRIEGSYRLAPGTLMTTVVERWHKLRHPSIVHLKEAFTTKAFNDNSLIFVYDYHPRAMTLHARHFLQPAATGTGNRRRPVQQLQSTEQTLWSYISQIGSVVKAVHLCGLALRVLDATKILVTGKNRIRINAVGVADVLAYDGGVNLASFQQDDLIKMGHLLVNLACNSAVASSNLGKSIDHISRTYSNDFKNVVLHLLSTPSPMKTIDEAISMSGTKLLTEMDSLRAYEDVLEGELAKELENGRLVRLLCKLGFINERPEFDRDPKWSETGDRYLLKLFRDYVFHQVDEHGSPVVDMAHVVMCLNKLDVGTEEKIMLMSRDEHNCLIVSYAELKFCMETVFSELTHKRPNI